MDKTLFHLDSFFQVDVFALMSFISHYPEWVKVLDFFYQNWVYFAQILLVYLCLIDKYRFSLRVLHLVAIGLILASIIFYCFPSLGLSALKPHFWLVQPAHCQLIHNCVDPMNLSEYVKAQRHDDLRRLSFFHAGFITFPSFHFYSAL